MLNVFLNYLFAILQAAIPVFVLIAGIRGLIVFRGFDRVLSGFLIVYTAMATLLQSYVPPDDRILVAFADIVALSPLALWAALPELSRQTRSPAG